MTTFFRRKAAAVTLGVLALTLAGGGIAVAQPATKAPAEVAQPGAQQAGVAGGLPPIGIGRDCQIHHAIIDKNARLGDGVRLSPAGKPDGAYAHGIVIRDGVLVVPKGGIVPGGTVV